MNIKFCMSALIFESLFTFIILYFNLFNSMNNNLNTIWIDDFVQNATLTFNDCNIILINV